MGVFDTLARGAELFVPAVGIVRDVVGLISGATPSVANATVPGGGAGLAGGTAVTRAISASTAVGPSIGAIGSLAGGTFIQAVAPIAATAARGAISAVLAPTPGTSATGGVRTVTRRQLILMTARATNPGATAKKIIRSARECGIELAAATFGLNVLDVCFLIAQPPTRRSRGISAADMRRTRSTIRKVHTISRQLTALKPAARRKH